MNGYSFHLADVELIALPTGALWWADANLLCVSDLHLGKSERMARRGGAMLPPYETRDTLSRLERDIELTGAATIVCLGDSFDDLGAAPALPEVESDWIKRLMAGRRWIWIEGNHDPGPLDFGGSHLATLNQSPLTFRHIAKPGEHGEISGHYHPKARLNMRGQSLSRPAFLIDTQRVILPAYGTYTGGLRTSAPELCSLMQSDTLAVLTGTQARAIPMPRK